MSFQTYRNIALDWKCTQTHWIYLSAERIIICVFQELLPTVSCPSGTVLEAEGNGEEQDEVPAIWTLLLFYNRGGVPTSKCRT